MCVCLFVYQIFRGIYRIYNKERKKTSDQIINIERKKLIGKEIIDNGKKAIQFVDYYISFVLLLLLLLVSFFILFCFDRQVYNIKDAEA